MKISDFEAGKTEKSYQYNSFLPNPINHGWEIDNPRTSVLLNNASAALGELKAYSQLVPNVDFFIQMHIAKEAVTSSRIEGTRTNMEEAFIPPEEINPGRKDDWTEVNNYIEAMSFALKKIWEFPVSNRLLRDTHSRLMHGVRGQHKQPGEFRTSQNWIGTSLKNAVFVPPLHNHLPDLMGDMEKFIHNDGLPIPHLIKIAIIHYQFETIHPFLDGNGRLGRLLIVLYLVNFGLLDKPALYLSDFFERNKPDYYDHLMAVRTNNKLDVWIQFFLMGVQETASTSIKVLKEVIALKSEIEAEVLPRIHNRKIPNANQLLLHLYKKPVVQIGQVAALLGIAFGTASALIKDFVRLGILRENTEKARNRLYVFDRYMKLFR